MNNHACTLLHICLLVLLLLLLWLDGNLNQMAVMTWKYSSSTDQITYLSLKIEIDLYAEYPAEPSHLKSLLSSVYLPVFMLFVLDGRVCCDEDKQAPSSEDIEDAC